MAEYPKWDEIFAVWLSKKINDVVVDKDGNWKIQLFNDVISKIGESFTYKNPSNKTTFTTGQLKTPYAEGICNYFQAMK